MKIDAYLLLRDFNDKPVQGEALDFRYKDQIAIFDFGLGSGKASEDADSATAEATEKLENADEKMEKVVEYLDQLSQDRKPKDTVKTALDSARFVSKQLKIVQKQLEAALRQEEETLEELRKQAEAKASAKPEDKPGEKLTFSISKDVDKSSPELFQAYCWSQTPRPFKKANEHLGKFKTAIVALRKMFEGQAGMYLMCSFRDVEIYDYSVKYDSGRAALVEEIEFKFLGYRFYYQAQTDTGRRGESLQVEGATERKAKK